MIPAVPLREALAADLLRYLNRSADHQPASYTLKARVSAWMSMPVQCVLLYRISHWLWLRNWKRAARMASLLNTFLFRANLSPAASIGPGLLLPHPSGACFCGSAGSGLTIFPMGVCWPLPEDGCDAERGPRIGDDVVIGCGASVLGPVNIGSGTKIGYRVTLYQDAPARALAVSRIMRVSIAKAEE